MSSPIRKSVRGSRTTPTGRRFRSSTSRASSSADRTSCVKCTTRESCSSCWPSRPPEATSRTKKRPRECGRFALQDETRWRRTARFDSDFQSRLAAGMSMFCVSRVLPTTSTLPPLPTNQGRADCRERPAAHDDPLRPKETRIVLEPSLVCFSPNTNADQPLVTECRTVAPVPTAELRSIWTRAFCSPVRTSRTGALDALDLGDVTDGAHDVREVPAVAHLHGEKHGNHVVAIRAFHGYVGDVRAGVGDLGRQFGQQPTLIGHQQPDAGFEHALDVGGPFDVDNLVAVDPAFFQRLAFARMHQEPLPASELAENGVARNGTAALAVLYGDALDAAQLQGAGLRRRRHGFFPGAIGRASKPLRDDE